MVAHGPRSLCDREDCPCFARSFASSPHAAEFDAEKNEGITARQVFLNSGAKIHAKCATCAHGFEIAPSHANSGQWCPYCANKRLCDLDCATCHAKSFASSPHAAEFDAEKNEGIAARQVFLNSNTKIHAKCATCAHGFEIAPNVANSGSWCPYCANQRLCDLDCATCHAKSFASSPHAAEFDAEKNEGITARQVFLNSHTKIHAKCATCAHGFEIAPNVANRGRWCPSCKHKTEKLVYEEIRTVYPSAVHGYRPEWSKNPDTGRCLPFDIAIPELRIIVEVDGPQHFESVAAWRSCPAFQLERDRLKETAALANDHSILRVCQESVARAASARNAEYAWDYRAAIFRTIEEISALRAWGQRSVRCVGRIDGRYHAAREYAVPVRWK